jgi:hypothetical protein
MMDPKIRKDLAPLPEDDDASNYHQCQQCGDPIDEKEELCEECYWDPENV